MIQPSTFASNKKKLLMNLSNAELQDSRKNMEKFIKMSEP